MKLDNRKIRYVWRNKKTGELWLKVLELSSIEEKGPKFFLNAKLRAAHQWELISRDYSTGLQDKNGKEIFDGDVINRTLTEFHPTDKDGVWKVVFVTGCFCLESMDGNDGRFLFQELTELEIIGNVHENPELL